MLHLLSPLRLARYGEIIFITPEHSLRLYSNPVMTDGALSFLLRRIVFDEEFQWSSSFPFSPQTARGARDVGGSMRPNFLYLLILKVMERLGMYDGA